MVRDSLRQRFLSVLKSLEGSAGNGRLQTELGWSDDTYWRVHAALIEDGSITKGRGRGGSVTLATIFGDGGLESADDHLLAAAKDHKLTRLSRDICPANSLEQKDMKRNQPATARSSSYKHKQEGVQRPDVGVEAHFANKKLPKSYRYDSSLAPELIWDENADRPFAEWLLNLISDAAEQGEAVTFADSQIWKGTDETFTSLLQCTARLKSLTKPFLNWAGKAERQQISVPTLPLFVHERHSTQAILETLKDHRARGTNLDLFGDAELDVADRLDAYEHKGPWTNRLILGDSLQVMNSLLEYEGMGGQVQMIYFDPPYGVKFGSNFQPFVRDKKVRDNHGKDDYMVREPEMVKAYRDTWELGLHSYLSYLRDRIFLSKDLLSDSGSMFIQISDDNVHVVRSILDEIFGSENFVSQIVFKKTGGFSGNYLSSNHDFVLWYAKNKDHLDYNALYIAQPEPERDDPNYVWLEYPDGRIRRMTPEERRREASLPENVRIFRYGPLTSDGASKEPQPLKFEGQTYFPGPNSHWKTTQDGMNVLKQKGLLIKSGPKGLAWKMYWDNFPAMAMDNVWQDTQSGGFNEAKLYVVQTTTKTISRCMLMSTKPGDLVLDITCGSGTTAVVAEQWGRRWITCDTSRVPLALARQRLLTATFPWYGLKEPSSGPSGGFLYARKQNRKGEDTGGLMPRTTLRTFAKNEEPEMVTLVDRPQINNQTTRVSSAFTVEATIQAAMTLSEKEQVSVSSNGAASPRAYLDRMIQVLRQSKTLRLPGNARLELDAVRTLAEPDYLHAEAIARNGTEKRIAIVFGPEDGAIGSEYVFNASMEAMQQGFQQLFLFGFAIQAKAREMLEKLKIPTTYIAMTPDVVMSDLLKTSKTSEIFSITGLPDVTFEKIPDKDKGGPLYRVEVRGLDIFRPDTMETDSIAAENLPCWMLDTDYNGMAFCASQVFFPKTGAWDNLQKSLKGEFSDSVWEHLAGTVSEPFALGTHERIAVKVIDDRGNELMVVKTPGRAN